jgi:hypothetical protein
MIDRVYVKRWQGREIHARLMGRHLGSVQLEFFERKNPTTEWVRYDLFLREWRPLETANPRPEGRGSVD